MGRKKTRLVNVDAEFDKAKSKGEYPFLFKEGDKVTVTLNEGRQFGWYERTGLLLDVGTDHRAVIMEGPGQSWPGSHYFYRVKIPVAGLLFAVADVAVEDIRKRGR